MAMRAALTNAMENGHTYKDVAKKVGCSVGVLNKFLTKKETIKFEIVLETVRLLMPEKEEEFMIKYCSEISKPDHIKVALEYCSTHQFLDCLYELIDRGQKHTNKEMQQWAYYYKVIADWKMGNINHFQMEEMIVDNPTKIPDLKVLGRFMQVYFLNKTKNYNLINDLSDQIICQIESLDCQYIKESFTSRFYQILSHISLRVNNMPIKARTYAKKIVEANIGLSFTAHAYHTLALSYFNDNKMKMNHYFNKSIELYSNIYSSQRINDLKTRFVKLNAIMENDMDMKLEKDDSDFLDLYIEGMRKNDHELLMECAIRFINSGDRFLASLPEKELQKHGYKESLLTALLQAN